MMYTKMAVSGTRLEKSYIYFILTLVTASILVLLCDLIHEVLLIVFVYEYQSFVICIVAVPSLMNGIEKS